MSETLEILICSKCGGEAPHLVDGVCAGCINGGVAGQIADAETKRLRTALEKILKMRPQLQAVCLPAVIDIAQQALKGKSCESKKS